MFAADYNYTRSSSPIINCRFVANLLTTSILEEEGQLYLFFIGSIIPGTLILVCKVSIFLR